MRVWRCGAAKNQQRIMEIRQSCGRDLRLDSVELGSKFSPADGFFLLFVGHNAPTSGFQHCGAATEPTLVEMYVVVVRDIRFSISISFFFPSHQ